LILIEDSITDGSKISDESKSSLGNIEENNHKELELIPNKNLNPFEKSIRIKDEAVTSNEEKVKFLFSIHIIRIKVFH